MNLFLIGYRGTGKTSVGQAVAARLGWKWADTDQVIVAEQGCSISDIFERIGEAGFRECEAGAVQRLASGSDQVISLGGGAILRESNREALKQHGKCVWLSARPETILRRLAKDVTTPLNRPPLTDLTPLDEILSVLKVRTPIYQACADLILSSDEYSVRELADRIVKWFSRYRITQPSMR
jgi:shikimate kinase